MAPWPSNRKLRSQAAPKDLESRQSIIQKGEGLVIVCRNMAEKLDELKAHLLQDVQGLEEGDKDVDDLDSGAYGFVFKVSVAGLPCMAKKLHRILTNKEVSADDRKCIQGKFYDECVLLSKLSHPNIVHFVGVCYGKSKSDLMLVMERLKSDLASSLRNVKTSRYQSRYPFCSTFLTVYCTSTIKLHLLYIVI